MNILNRIMVTVTRMQSAANLFVKGVRLLPIMYVETPDPSVLFDLCPIYNLGVSGLGHRAYWSSLGASRNQ
jgi:hypothetical protein